MRLPFISRRAFDALGMAHSLLRAQLVQEQAARRKAEAGTATEWKLMIDLVEVEHKLDRQQVRHSRALRACARYRAELAAQRREIRQLTDRLFDACGYQGEPLLPAARVTLGIENAKEEG